MEKNSFFSLPDVVDVTLAEDGDMLITMPGFILGQTSSVTINIHPPPVSVHPFHTTWRLETQAKCPTAHPTLRQPIPRPTVLPTRYICLMQNCVMMLLYTAQCNPEILIWSLDKGKNDSKAEITSYNDCDTLLQALRDDGSYVSPYSAIDSLTVPMKIRRLRRRPGRILTTIHTATRSL